MVRAILSWLFFGMILIAVPCHSQTWGSNPLLNEYERYYVKSLNEFIHRFNGDEFPPFINADDDNKREKCVLALFDLEQAPDLESPMAKKFLRFDSAVCASNHTISMKDSGLYAEAYCLFKYKKRDLGLSIILQYENTYNNYYRWVITGVRGLLEAGLLDTVSYGYLNPVQHELRFSELSEAFPHMKGFWSKKIVVDPLSYLAGLAETEVLKFENCQSVTFWFTQVPDYIFSVSLHPRLGMNAGWLIHDVIEADSMGKKAFTNYLKGY